MQLELSKHARNMMTERNISEAWIRSAVTNPDRKDAGMDNNIHYFKSIPEHGGRILHVVLNARVAPARVVTAFFDRSARRKT